MRANLNPETLALLERLGANGGGTGGDAGLPSVTYDPNDPSKTLAQLTDRGWARYEQDYIPVENDAIASLDDMSIIDDARTRAGDSNILDRAKQRSERELSRYGLRMNNAQKANQDVNLGVEGASTAADTMNNARINQFDRNRGFRNQLINIGRGIAGDAQAGLSDAAGMQTGRENANRNARAAASAQDTQLFGGLASTAVMAAMMM